MHPSVRGGAPDSPPRSPWPAAGQVATGRDRLPPPWLGPGPGPARVVAADPAPWPPGQLLATESAAASRARHLAQKDASVTRACEHLQRLRLQEEGRMHEAAARAQSIHIGDLIQRGDD
mmetsp:Transcript_30860/g.98555  ORF Transcript_30860/g.98555 Transcript_30860/m.98555 type:complete len:119 (+) Transcript_30860:418-774(+)